MKPEYSDQTANLDVIILGGYYGNGTKRAGLLSHFLVGVADHTTMGERGELPADPAVAKFFTIGKVRSTPNQRAHNKKKAPLLKPCCQVGTGYTVAELTDLNERVKDFATPFVKSSKLAKGSPWPAYLHPWNMKADDVPDVFVPPDKVPFHPSYRV